MNLKILGIDDKRKLILFSALFIISTLAFCPFCGLPANLIYTIIAFVIDISLLYFVSYISISAYDIMLKKLGARYKLAAMIVLIIFAFIFSIFFFPKQCGNWGTSAENMGVTYEDCNCIGLKIKADWNVIRVGGGGVDCWGIVTEKLCYENRGDNSSGVWRSYRYYKKC